MNDQELEKAEEALRAFREACAAAFAKEVAAGAVLVFGEGRVRAPLMLIGEAPGEQESLTGRPFVGKAGKNLDQFLLGAALERAQLYIANAVKIRPTKTGASGRVSNRPPNREEIARFQPWLLREIALVQPRAIATLGNVALRAVTGEALNVGQAHGRWLARAGQPPLFPLYHPASVIYNRSLQAVYEQDIAVLGRCLSAGRYTNDI